MLDLYYLYNRGPAIKKKRTEMKKFKKVETELEMQFLEKCVKEEDFNTYIGNVEIDGQAAFLFCASYGTYLGVLFPVIQKRGEIKVAIPIIYLTKKRDRESSWYIANSIPFIFDKFGVEKIQFIVYGFNTRTLNLLNNFKIEYDGKIPNAILIKNRKIDVLYYSILKEEYENFRREFNAKYTAI